MLDVWLCLLCSPTWISTTRAMLLFHSNLLLTFTLWSRSHRLPEWLNFLGGRLFSLLHVPQQRAGVYQSPGSVSWELSQDKGKTRRSAAECIHTYSEEPRESRTIAFIRRKNRKASCGPLPCVVIDLTVVILGGSRETRASHLIDVSLRAHCNGKHFTLSASRPDLYSILWHITNYSHFPTQTH